MADGTEEVDGAAEEGMEGTEGTEEVDTEGMVATEGMADMVGMVVAMVGMGIDTTVALRGL